MRRSPWQALATMTVAGIILASCANGDDTTNDPSTEEPSDEQADTEDDDGSAAPDEGAEQDLEDLMGEQDLEDPNEDVDDGRFSGAGVVLPVPDGWSLDQMAYAQGQVVALPEDGEQQQLSAAAFAAEQVETTGQPADLDTLLDSIREQVGEDADVDEEVELAGADRAHRLTFLDLASQQEGGPESSVTVVLAEDGEGHIGEFSYSAVADSYDDDNASLLVTEAGFDPDSEPIELPQPEPAPEG